MRKTAIDPEIVDVVSFETACRITIEGEHVGEIGSDGKYRPVIWSDELQGWRLGENQYGEEDVKAAVVAAAEKEGWEFHDAMEAWLES